MSPAYMLRPPECVKARARVLARVVPVLTPHGECWETNGYRRPDGYGEISFEGRKWLLHRLAYTAFVGPIPEGLDLDHLCRNRACANPAHVEPVTRAVNLARGVGNKPRTHCPSGHAMEGDNIYVHPRGFRQCIICSRESRRRWEARNRPARRAA